MTVFILQMVFSLCLLTHLPTEVTSFDVSFEKVSTLFLPYTYSPSVQYALDKDAAEQMLYDPTQRLIYSVGHTNVHVIDMSDISDLAILYNVSYTDVDASDVEMCGGFIFVAMNNIMKREEGFVNVYRAYNKERNTLELVHQITVGATPDMIKPTSDCSRLVVAVEGVPYDTAGGLVDPPGGIGIIKFATTPSGSYNVSVLDFDSFNTRYPELEESGTRFIYRGNNNTFSNDLEPEYIAFNHDETKAYVALQENNAIAVLDLETETIENIFGLGYKNWMLSALDPNDRDGINLNPWPVYGMYQPDAITVYRHRGVDYIITANEGGSKDYEGFSEETRVYNQLLSEDFESNSTERERLSVALGRLKISTLNGKNTTTGEFDQLYSFGGRGFSIWRADTMEQVYDSGRDIDWRISTLKPHLFNNNPGTDELITETVDKRSDDKGAETESVITAPFGRYTLVIIGNERPGTISVYSIDNELDTIEPKFETLLSDIPDVNETWNQVYNDRRLSMADPEDLRFVPADQSPNGDPLLLVSGSYSGTITVYKINVNDFEEEQNPNTSSTVLYNTGVLFVYMVWYIVKTVI